MVRLKFLLFALLVLGLGLAHLPFLSGPLGARAVQAATEQASVGAAQVTRQLDARRAVAREAALLLASSSRLRASLEAALLSAEGGVTPLSAEGFGPIRKAAEAALPKELGGAVVAVVTGGQAQHSRLGTESNVDAALDVQALARAGGVQLADAFGAPHVFTSVPLMWDLSDVEPAPLATLVVGVPLVAEGTLETAMAATGTSALLLLKGETLVGSAGAEKATAEGSLAKLTLDQPGVVLRRGELALLGPVKLPVLTQKDALGGQAPLTVGVRRSVEGTPFEVVALASTKAVLAPLADYQQLALFGLGGLLGLSLVWTVLMGGGKRAAAEPQGTSDTLNLSGAAVAAQPAAQPAPLAQAMRSPPEAAPADEAFPFPPAPAAQQPAPAAPADDFPFGAPPPAAAEAFPFPPPPAPGAAASFPFPPPDAETTAPYPVVASMPGGMAAPPPPAPAPAPTAAAMPFDPEPFGAESGIPTASSSRSAYAFEDNPTAAYSVQQATDALAQAAAEEEGREEATMVAPIPRELLQAAVRPQGLGEAIPLAPPRNSPAAPPPGPAQLAQAAIPLPGVAAPGGGNSVVLTDEQHFQDVFREFVSTRERCSEPADGLTYDKFVQKLRKNREQLMAKYACKTVRFQVYVKEGKAALKATPVKD
jgi:hypothetical protein